jgi:hypothetical protein
MFHINSGIVLPSGGSYIFFDAAVSSPSLPASTTLPDQLLASLSYFADVDSFSSVPFVARGISEAASPDDVVLLRKLRYFIVAGAPTPQSLFQWAADNEIAYTDICGATEVIWIARRRALYPREIAHGLSVSPGLMGVLNKAHAEDGYGELILLGKVCTFFPVSARNLIFGSAQGLPTCYDNAETGAYSYDQSTDITTYRTGDLYHHTTDVESSAIILEGQAIPPFDAGRLPLTGQP